MNKPAEIETGAMEEIKTSFPDKDTDKKEKSQYNEGAEEQKSKKAQRFPLPQRGGF